MRVLIDADACPVVDIAVSLCRKYGIPCLLLCDTAHELYREGAETHIFDKGADSVDFALANRVHPGDLVITQDYGLAAMCLARQAYAMHQDGGQYTPDNMDGLLAARHTARCIRRQGGRLRGAPKRTPAQDQAFCRALEAWIHKMQTT